MTSRDYDVILVKSHTQSRRTRNLGPGPTIHVDPLTVAAPAIDKVGPRPYHFRLGPTSGPTTRQQEAKKVNYKISNKIYNMFITWH